MPVLAAKTAALFATLLLAMVSEAADGSGRREPSRLDCTGRDGVAAAEVRNCQEAWARYLGCGFEEEVEIAPNVKMAFVLIPPGRFLMGSPAEEPGRTRDEVQHGVTLTRAFYLGRSPVTQEQYRALTGKNPSENKGDLLPVETVNWFEARDFAAALTKRLGRERVFRLPTEAEWEYACRAGHPATHPFGVGPGRTLTARDANIGGKEPYNGADTGATLGKTSPVGSYPANAFGLFDMHGNVCQWCADYLGPYGGKDEEDPTGPANPPGPDPTARVFRGGIFNVPARCCRAAVRIGTGPAARFEILGFRLAYTVAPGGDLKPSGGR